VAHFYNGFAEEQGTGGALAQYGDRYLLATGDGDLFVFSWSPETKRLERTKLSVHVPMNRGEFERDAAGKKVYTKTFRTADVLLQDFGDDFRLFASHHHWDADKQCFTVRVSAVTAAYRDFERATDASVRWETVYDSQPCLHFKDRNDPFGGEQVGGKMVLLDAHRMLLSVGDQMYDGVESKEILPQDPTAHYGKTILIDLDSKKSSVYTLGHRNPQGLTVDAEGNIWETEHGPQGGDELNHIDQGRNYGWPLVTYGRNYGRLTWPLNPKPGRHEDYELPSHAWVPSIGVSALAAVKGDLFEYWKDDLLAASLGDQSLWRIRTDHNRTVLTERLKVGKRIRDVMEDRNGRLVLWTEENQLAPTQTAIVIIEPVTEKNPTAMAGLSRLDRGELGFDSCIGCHRIEDGKSHGIGPDLKGVFGRRSASAADYGYSDALKAFSTKWTAKTLDDFLENPESVVPGTSMHFAGIADAEQRASIIEYLQNSH
jgi:glucose/arabinose dehydrogenase/cytochrome c2